MKHLPHKVSEKIGLAPGTVSYIGAKKVENVAITAIDYDATNLQEHEVTSIEECFPFKDTPTITWINIDGLHDVDIVEKIGKHFGMHPLVMEDIVNPGQRPKIEDTTDYIFLVVKMLYNDPDGGDIISEQVSIIYGNNFVISFQEREGDVFNYVRDRLRKAVPRVRFMGADYLAYALVDAIIDHYFLVLEAIGEKIESMEDELVKRPQVKDLELIHDLKRKLIHIRKSIWPLREVIGGWDRLETKLIQDYTRAYLRDLYEHTIQVIDTVETFRDMVSGLLDIYLSSISNRMNEIMKVLTIIATIFIPLGFLAGVFGMNFDPTVSPYNMPELGFRYGYLMFWIVVMLVGGGLFLFFKRKRWL
ncbi:magnesium transporter [bacterium SM23_57]|nr:MAG: magnesium transporter [bacterium SM23_57]